MLNIATFNVFWYPGSDVAQNGRSAADERRIIRVLKSLGPQVVVFQEILDLERLEHLLERVGDNLHLKSPAGSWLASGAYSMNIACAYDADVLEFIAGAKLDDPLPERRFSGRRYPFALHLRHRDTDWEFTVAGVHFKSGALYGSDSSSEKREDEVEHLAAWLRGEPDAGAGHFEQPPTPDVVVIGDFNALRDHGSLAQLQAGALETWHRPLPQVLASPGDEGSVPLEDTGEQWTTYLDREVIDHVIVSPGVESRLSGPPAIFAFDRDPAMDDYPSPAGHWLRRETSYKVQPYYNAGLQTVANLYRISDHRPVVVSLDPS